MGQFVKVAAAVLLVMGMSLHPRSATSADYVLTIGGGYSPTGNQLSIERNVLFFQQVVAERLGRDVPHTVLFSDGDKPDPDVQFEDRLGDVPRANHLMAKLFGSEKYLGLKYRDHAVPNVAGSMSRENLAAQFDALAEQLQAGDRLFVYATAHGGKSRDKKDSHRTRLYLWNTENVDVGQFDAELNKLPEGVQVVLVMVQCYSGGFSHLAFADGKPDKGPSRQDRCGFFSTMHDRFAAGCAADTDEEKYEEYSSYFWAALWGKSRTGSSLKEDGCGGPDYDGDDQVSLAEAHAYTLLVSDTVDIPVTCRGALLRARSRLPGDRSAKERKPGKEAEKKSDKKNEKREAEKESADRGKTDSPQLIAATASYEQLLPLASPAEAAVLAGLAERLNLPRRRAVEAARERIKKIEQSRGKLAEEQKQLKEKAENLRKPIARAIKARWPAVANLLNVEVVELLSTRADEFVAEAEAHPDLAKYEKLLDEIEEIDARRLDLDRARSKCRRLIRVAENAALAANLQKVGTAEDIDWHARIRRMEATTLGPQRVAESGK